MDTPDLSIEFCGLKAPNPFWLASGPPSNTEGQVKRAFEAGWGGAVWKTITDQPIRNTTSRYGAIYSDRRKLIGLSNIELISDRPLDVNLREIAAVKKAWPRHPLFVSMMTVSTREAWQELVRRTQDAGADGLELNFSCPHGMNERDMGAVVAQVPEYTRMITEWVKAAARVPVMVKLTPNVTDPAPIAQAAVAGGADAIALINTVNSLMGVDLDTLAPRPAVDGSGTHGGFSGPAVKPIALHMVSAVARHPATRQTPLSGIGGISNWQDAAEFLLLGATTVQVCTAVMHHGFGIIDAYKKGLAGWMQQQGWTRVSDLVGKGLPRIKAWGELNLNYRVVARIDQETCIHCGQCYTCCLDGCYQAIQWDRVPFDEFLTEEQDENPSRPKGAVPKPTSSADCRLPAADSQPQSPDLEDAIDVYAIRPEACVGCNMCSLICPVEGCITMVPVDSGKPPLSWNELQAPKKAGNH